uniref:hypothetical protein n=1 Tax=Paractinoplanes polyasparticus TaxID=2856853 RepID=UPI001C843267|nr:hypothetical protein [Actinoplanes polyasparticus]
MDRHYCYGTTGRFQADCGSSTAHLEHDFTDTARVCEGAPAGFEADCGKPGPHLDHFYSSEAQR